MSEELFREQMGMAGLTAREDGGIRSESRRLHSKYDPWKEARAQIPIELDQARTLLVFGAGLGYVISILLQEGVRVLWIETDPGILREALGLHDFRHALRSGSLKILESMEPGTIAECRLTNENAAFWSHRSFLTPELSALRAKTEFLLNRQSVNQATLSRFERTWAVNLCANLITLRGSRPVRELFGIHRGSPAVVIGAGPSLTDSLPALARLREKAVYVAVDTAVRVLQHEGVDPDYIVTVDPQPVNRVFLESYAGNARIVLDPTVSHHSASYAARNMTFIAATPFRLGRLFEGMVGGTIGDIAFGGSVSTNAYDLARKMGCDPVYLVGQDLSFPDGQVHARGAALEERLSWRESRLVRREMHNFSQLTAIPPLVIEDLRGGKVQTNGKLAIFYRWFESRFEADMKAGLTVRNCTLRGARFRNTAGSLEELETAEALGKEKSRSTAEGLSEAELQKRDHVLMTSIGEVLERLNGINSAYCAVWAIRDLDARLEELDKLGTMLRQMPDVELLGNTAQSAIQRANPEDPAAADSLHRSLHGACLLLIRCLGRVERILKASQAHRS